MPRTRRTQAQRTTATRRTLVRRATRLFAQHGYAAVGTEQLVAACGLTRGALYHHFDGKRGLFEAVVIEMQSGIAREVEAAAASAHHLWEGIKLGCRAFIEACARREVRQVLLVDATSVLGIERWRQIDAAHGLASLADGLRASIDAGVLPDQPVEPLARLISGALNEAALWLAERPRSARRRADVLAAIDRLLDRLVM